MVKKMFCKVKGIASGRKAMKVAAAVGVGAAVLAVPEMALAADGLAGVMKNVQDNFLKPGLEFIKYLSILGGTGLFAHGVYLWWKASNSQNAMEASKGKAITEIVIGAALLGVFWLMGVILGTMGAKEDTTLNVGGGVNIQ